MENKIEYRMIDHDMFDEDMIREMNSMGEKGWKVIRILDPMKWLNSDGMFIRVFYEREQSTNAACAYCRLYIVGSSNGFKMTNEQLQKDIKFLAERQLKAGSVSFMRERETGISSNSIVAIAYGLEPLEKQRFPSDISDMQSCENMWKNLPEHRKTGEALKAMEAARNCDYYGKR